ncbi:hypothetical protein LPJ75_001490 [Coemansia sp. RSA 2598]|nr:hypothetical protein LPJ75_001490 [Coemansia sp. RSA 2598]
MSASSVSTLSNTSFMRSQTPEPQFVNYCQETAVYAASKSPANIIIPKHRNAGIGGYSNVYSPSGIGGHVMHHRDMGIGKACLSQSPRVQELSSSSPSPSPFKRVFSFSNLRSMSRSSSSPKKE